MNTIIFAFIALLAVTQAVPYGRIPSYGVPYAPAQPVVYQQLPVTVQVVAPKYAAPKYAAPAPISYGAPAQISYALPSAPLIAAPSNPQASASASAVPGILRPGAYKQLAIPSYNIVSAEPAPEANIGSNYGLAPALILPSIGLSKAY